MGFVPGIKAFTAAVLGGIGSIPGVVIGAVFLIGLPEILREFAEYRLLMYGAALVIMMLTRPEGLLILALAWLAFFTGRKGETETRGREDLIFALLPFVLLFVPFVLFVVEKLFYFRDGRHDLDTQVSLHISTVIESVV